MRRILILSASYGEGHNSAARAVRAAFAEHPGVEVEIFDLFAQKAPRLDRLSRRTYLRVINHAPRLWSSLYQWLDRSPSAPLLFRALGGHAQLLAHTLRARRPDAVVSTYPVYAWLFQQLRASGYTLPPLYTVVTDALTINSLWYRAPSAGWFVTDGASAAFLHRARVPAAQVHVSGFPVAAAFADRDPTLQPPDPTRTRQRRILYMINSGRTRALETAKVLTRWSNWQITFTVGRDEILKQRLAQLVRGAPARCEILGWTDRIPELLMTHHVVISKAGGATTQESIAALCPMIVNQVVPGQEEGNWQLLRSHQAGALAETPSAISQTLHTVFAHEGARWREMRAGLRRLARPTAARDIATQVLAALPQLSGLTHA
ncbi:MAG: galactosyldiacylglycerol synthase [Opitutae bacterium]|nr:galactosyldiacylglycerol synthase [Opitutae bacterium]